MKYALKLYDIDNHFKTFVVTRDCSCEQNIAVAAKKDMRNDPGQEQPHTIDYMKMIELYKFLHCVEKTVVPIDVIVDCKLGAFSIMIEL